MKEDMEQRVVIGTELKINVHAEPVDGISMEAYDFYCDFYVIRGRFVRVPKSEMIYIDKDNYIATLDTREVGLGILRLRMTALVPDDNFADGYRTEVVDSCVEIIISE